MSTSGRYLRLFFFEMVKISVRMNEFALCWYTYIQICSGCLFFVPLEVQGVWQLCHLRSTFSDCISRFLLRNEWQDKWLRPSFLVGDCRWISRDLQSIITLSYFIYPESWERFPVASFVNQKGQCWLKNWTGDNEKNISLVVTIRGFCISHQSFFLRFH